MLWPALGLPWVPTSPAIRAFASALVVVLLALYFRPLLLASIDEDGASAEANAESSAEVIDGGAGVRALMAAIRAELVELRSRLSAVEHILKAVE